MFQLHRPVRDYAQALALGSGRRILNHQEPLAIRRDEAAWKSRLVTVVEARWSFLEGRTVRPEICYEVAPIAYQWARGRLIG